MQIQQTITGLLKYKKVIPEKSLHTHTHKKKNHDIQDIHKNSYLCGQASFLFPYHDDENRNSKMFYKNKTLVI